MDLSGNSEWDFSNRHKRNEVREWILRCKPLLVVGPDPGVVVRNAMGRADVKDRSAEHQAFMMEVIEIQREGGRKYYHEFPEDASSMKLRKARKAREHQDNREVIVGQWSAGGRIKGKMVAMTNIQEVMQGKWEHRDVDVLSTQRRDRGDVEKAILKSMAASMVQQGRMTPGGQAPQLHRR